MHRGKTGSGLRPVVSATGLVTTSVRGERCRPSIAVDAVSSVLLDEPDPPECTW